MFRQMLYLQWKVSRWALLPFILLGFGIPLLVLQLADARSKSRPFDASASEILEGQAVYALQALNDWTVVFPLLAALLGITVALTAWLWDHRGDHIYALTLPLPRWEYVLLKLGAGVAVMLIPVAAVWAGAVLGTLTMRVPEGLHAYPAAFGARFLLASMLAYSTAFAFAAGTVRTALIVIIGLILVVIFGSVAVEFLNQAFEVDLTNPLDFMQRALTQWPGPFNVFGGNWMIVDV